MGRPLSPPQIHQKNIWTLSKFHKTILIAGRGHQAPRKAAHCLQKEVGKNTKDKKRDKRGRDGAPSWESKVKSLSCARLFATPWLVACTKLLRPWDFQGKSTGLGCHFLLQGIIPTQGSNPGLSHCRQTLYHLNHQRRES